MIKPHGGKLINRVLSENKRDKILTEFQEMAQLKVNNEVVEDLFNISHGVFSPLEGFMGEEDVESILKNDRLTNDLPWTIPITFDVSAETAKKYSTGDTIALVNGEQIYGLLHLEQIFSQQ